MCQWCWGWGMLRWDDGEFDRWKWKQGLKCYWKEGRSQQGSGHKKKKRKTRDSCTKYLKVESAKKIGNKLSVVRRKERVKRESKTLVFFWRMFRIFTEMKESARRTGKKQYILLSNNIELEWCKSGFKSQLFRLLVVAFAHISLVPWGYFLISVIIIIPSPLQVTMQIKSDRVYRTHCQA